MRVSHFGILLVPRHFDTKLPLKAGEWNAIRLVKRYEKLFCTVNGQTKAFPYDRRPIRFAGAIFGGETQPGPGVPPDAASFKGLLRALRVRHFVED